MAQGLTLGLVGQKDRLPTGLGHLRGLVGLREVAADPWTALGGARASIDIPTSQGIIGRII